MYLPADELRFDEARAGQPRIIEGFEGIEPSWGLRSGLQGIQIGQHQRTSKEKRTGNQSEFIQFKTGNKTQARLVHTLKAAQAIKEFCPFVWLKSNQDAIKLSVRVVLPKTKNPVGDGPLQVLVELDQSMTTGQWEQLGCVPGGLLKCLNGRLRSIQFQFQKLEIDTTDAYCDLITLSGFDRPRTEYKIWLDDLSHSGFLPARINHGNVSYQSAGQNANLEVEVKDQSFRVNGKPVFLRVVRHNGESLAFLKQLGFNGVIMDRIPTLTELDQAQQYQIWIICTAPEGVGPSEQSLLKSSNLEMIFAWNLGSHLTSKDLGACRKVVKSIDQLKPLIDRPVFCHAYFPRGEFAQIVDFWRCTRLVHGTSFTVENFRRYLGKTNGGSRPFLVDIQTELPGKIKEQSQLLARNVGHGLLSRDQIVQLTFEAIYAGSRGLVFQSATNLEQDSLVSRWLNPVFRSINRELLQMEPWIAGGIARPHAQKKISAVSFDLPRSQLTLARKVAGPLGKETDSSVELSLNQQAPKVYQIVDTGLVPVPHLSRAGKLKVNLEQHHDWEKFVVSEDPLSLDYIQKAAAMFADDGGLLHDKYLVLQNSFERLQSLVEPISRDDINCPNLFVSLADLRENLSVTQTLLSRAQWTKAVSLMKQIENRMKLVINSLQQELMASRQMISSSFNADFGQLANYIEFEKLLKKKKWSENLLASGCFDSLKSLTDDGWQQHVNTSDGIDSDVRIVDLPQGSPDRLRVGRGTLEIQNWRPSGNSDSLVSVTPVWLSSPKISVDSGQVVRVDGYIRLDQPISESLDGFMIIDSIGGPDLGARFVKTDGWRYFAIERMVPEPMEFSLILAHTGLGKAQLTNLQVRICDLAGSPSISSERKKAVKSLQR